MAKLLVVLLSAFSTLFAFADDKEEIDQVALLKQMRSNSVALKTAIQAGEERSTLCGYCHGKDSNSIRKDVPNLAGQNEEYLINQFNLFATGARKNYVMERLARVVTPEERVNVALYYASLEVKNESHVPSSERGKRIYQSYCFACHGHDGLGSKDLPRLAGQQQSFLEKTLNAFKEGKAYRKQSPMITIMEKVDRKDISQLAAYISSMK